MDIVIERVHLINIKVVVAVIINHLARINIVIKIGIVKSIKVLTKIKIGKYSQNQ